MSQQEQNGLTASLVRLARPDRGRTMQTWTTIEILGLAAMLRSRRIEGVEQDNGTITGVYGYSGTVFLFWDEAASGWSWLVINGEERSNGRLTDAVDMDRLHLAIGAMIRWQMNLCPDCGARVIVAGQCVQCCVEDEKRQDY